MTDSRRYAIDWQLMENGKVSNGDNKVSSFFGYRKPVFAVADGTVVVAVNNLPDNTPGHGSDFHPAIPITADNLAGDVIVIDLGGGQFAHYDHLRQGSLKIKAGDNVKRGQEIAQVGSSGDSREPHLHFEVTTGIGATQTEGLPYLMTNYRIITSPDGQVGIRKAELPLNNMIIDFKKN